MRCAFDAIRPASGEPRVQQASIVRHSRAGGRLGSPVSILAAAGAWQRPPQNDCASQEGATPKPGAVRGPMWRSSERSRSGWDGEFESPLLQRRVACEPETLRSLGGVISNNARHGVSVFNSGTAILDTGAVVASNAADGVLVDDGTVNVGNGDGSATIQSNVANGIYLKTNSVGLFNNDGNQIVSNSGWGILCDGPPANPLIAIGLTATKIGTVSGNGAGQISCNIRERQG